MEKEISSVGLSKQLSEKAFYVKTKNIFSRLNRNQKKLFFLCFFKFF